MTAVELHDAEARIGRTTIWRDVSITIERGQFVAVLGPNGAGKSTLLRAILGLQPLSAGTATIHAERIGYLPQRRTFDETTRIRGIDLVRLGLDGARWGVPLPGARSREAGRRVDETIALVGASAYAERPLGELSGGEQQRLLIAQALVRKPQLLLLDEPLDGLDLPNQVGVAALVRNISEEQDVAVALVAHDVNPIISYLDGVVYFAAGTAVEGSPVDVITTETLSALYGVAVEVLRASDGRLVVVGAPDLHGHHAH